MSFFNLVPSLPHYSGPYKVGSTEYEIPISEIPSTSPTPDDSITTIKFRLFYPTPESASSKESVTWLPKPQRQWSEAYSSFLGASPRLARFISLVPSILNCITIPAIANVPLLPKTKSEALYPLAIFSHGLGGNSHVYSSICGSLASYGMVCAAPEHRDGSAPTSIIRKADGSISKTIPYQKHPHSPTEEIFNARNAQLRIRLWELELLYTTLSSMNAGKSFSNYAIKKDATNTVSLTQSLDLAPGHVTWSGHSFGAATITQFVKSVYYHQSIPSSKGTSRKTDLNWRPLYTPAANGELVKQITTSSPITLLDVWTMPLRGESTEWLWQKPLPCYEQSFGSKPNAVAVMSTEFEKWPELVKRTKALLSSDPVFTLQQLQVQDEKSSSKDQSSPQSSPPQVSALPAAITKVPSEATPISSSSSSVASTPDESVSPTSSQTSIAPEDIAHADIPLYTIPNTLHLSQSDFGILFYRLFKLFTKTPLHNDPAKIIEMNVHAMLKCIQGSAIDFDFGVPDTDLNEMGFVDVYKR